DLRRMDQEPDGRAWRSEPVAHAVGDGEHRLHAGERLAQDAGKEPGGGLVRLARAHADGRQADADAVEKTAAAVVAEQQFADRFLRAVAGERRVEEFVTDRLRKRRAEYRDGGGEDHPRLVSLADLADRLEQQPGAVEIDAIPL